MVKKKPSINQNFEALKAQMQAKRKLAENKFEKEKEENDTPIKTTLVPSNNVENSSINEEEEEYITLNIVDDDDFNELEGVQTTNKETDITNLNPKSELSNDSSEKEITSSDLSESLESLESLDDSNDDVRIEEKEEFVQSITPKSRKSETADINMNKIIIKRVEKQEAPKRITYYLKPETIKKIDKFSKATGMGKSEFVQTILDEILNNLEVEK